MNLQNKIEHILKLYPESRNSDIVLMTKLWECFYNNYLLQLNGESYLKLSNLYDVPRLDDISRIRRKIQNEERMYLPTDIEILIERARMSRDWKRFLGYAVDWDDSKWRESVRDFLNPKQIGLI